MEKAESQGRAMTAAEFFSGAFNNVSQPKPPTMTTFSDIQIPEFLKK